MKKQGNGELLGMLYNEDVPGGCAAGTVGEVMSPWADQAADGDSKPVMHIDLTKGWFKCLLTNREGGVLEYLMERRGMEREAAEQYIEAHEQNHGARRGGTPARPTPPEDSKVLPTLPDNEAVYEYLEKDGEMICVVLRKPWGKPRMLAAPFYHVTEPHAGWINTRAPRYRGKSSTPLYNLPALLKTSKGVRVFLAADEHTVETIKTTREHEPKFLPQDKIVPVTWMGGPRMWDRTDWRPMAHREVFIVCQADKESRQTMEKVARHLMGEHNCTPVNIVPLNAERPGTGLVDLLASMSPSEVLVKLRKERYLFEPSTPLPPSPSHDDPDDSYEMPDEGQNIDGGGIPADKLAEAEAAEDRLAENVEQFVAENREFEVQGYLGGSQEIIFLRKRGRLSHRVYKRLEQVNKPFLATLAHYRAWGRASQRFTRITDPVLQAAMSAIDKVATKKGSKSIKDYRGPGATMDGDRFVFHLGDRLLVDGRETDGIVPDMKPPLGNWYELEGSYPYIHPQDDGWRESGRRIADCILRYAWADPAHGLTCAGWLGSALASGALPWRLNIIMLARSNRGKSWLVNNILSRILRPMCHQTHDSTQAATSMKAGKTSVPFFVDEMDPNKFKDNIMPMMKASSSNSELKRSRVNTSTNQGVFELTVRTSFFACLAIKPVMTEEFENRIKVISMSNQRLSASEFDMLATEIDQVLEYGGAERLRDGLVANAHLLVSKEREFADLLAGNGKHADRKVHQRAVIAAGMWLLAGWELDETVGVLEAEVEQVDGRTSNDGLELLAKILSRPVPGEVEVEGRPQRYTRTMLEWLEHDVNVHRARDRVAEALGWKWTKLESEQRGGEMWSLIVSRNAPAHTEMMRAMDRRGLDLVNTVSNLDGVDNLRGTRIRFKGKMSAGVLRISPQLLERLDYTLMRHGRVDLEGTGRDDGAVPVNKPDSGYDQPRDVA